MKENRKATYLNLSQEEYDILDEQIEKLGFISRTDYFTACAHVIINGCSPEEWNKKLYKICEQIDKQKETFFEILDEKALGIIAMKGIGAVYSNLIGYIKAEMLEKCGMIPENCEIRDWLKIYKNLRRAELIGYRTEQYKKMFGENND